MKACKAGIAALVFWIMVLVFLTAGVLAGIMQGWLIGGEQ